MMRNTNSPPLCSTSPNKQLLKFAGYPTNRACRAVNVKANGSPTKMPASLRVIRSIPTVSVSFAAFVFPVNHPPLACLN